MVQSVRWVAVAVAILWAVHAVNTLLGGALNGFGLIPRHWEGMVGILTAPFLHGNWGHLIANTLPFAVMAFLICLNGRQRWIWVSLWIMLIGGLATWFFARDAVHVGASGLVFGYFGYLITYGLRRRDFRSVLIAIIVVAVYGGMVFGVLPLRAGVSFEMHLFGLIAGVLVAMGFVSRPKRRAA